MKEMIQIFKEHKIVLVAIIMLILMFVGWSVWQYGNRQAELQQQEQQAITEGETIDADTGDEVSNPQAELTDRQKDIISNYSIEQENFVALLSANIWMDATEASSLSFTENTYTEIKGTEKAIVPFAIVSVIEDNIVGEGSTYESHIASVETDSSNFILKLQRWVASDGTAGEWKLTSSGFTMADEYIRGSAAEGFVLEGMNDEAATLMGGTEDLTSSIADFVTATYPSASVATWNGKIEIDWSEQTTTARFNLDTKSSTQIIVVYRMDTNKISVN